MNLVSQVLLQGSFPNFEKYTGHPKRQKRQNDSHHSLYPIQPTARAAASRHARPSGHRAPAKSYGGRTKICAGICRVQGSGAEVRLGFLRWRRCQRLHQVSYGTDGKVSRHCCCCCCTYCIGCSGSRFVVSFPSPREAIR